MIDSERDAMWSGNGPGAETASSTQRFDEILPDHVRALVDPSRVRELVRSYPLSVAFGALALGFIVARAMRGD